MDTLRIFIGYNLSYEECLLEKRDTYYVDLITKRKYCENEIYENLLIPYSVLDPKQKNRLLCQVKQIYKKDRQKMLKLNELYIGDIGVINSIISKHYTGNSILNLGVETQYSYKLLEKDVLLEKTAIFDYRSVMYGIVIQDKGLIPEVGDYCLGKDGLTPFTELLSLNEISFKKPKKWVLEKYNKTYKKGVIQ